MIEPNKLYELSGGHRRRKLALCFGALERDIAGIPEQGNEYCFHSMPRLEYTKKLVSILLEDPALGEQAKSELEELLEGQVLDGKVVYDERRLCNTARNHLLSIIGTFPAEWDLVIAPHKAEPAQKRDFYPGLFVYCEDIRSPFNLGSIFRTAEAMGAQKVFISPFCVDPNHPRCLRSGMGCVENLPWERCTLEEAARKATPAHDCPQEETSPAHDCPQQDPTQTAESSQSIPVFALETGGTMLDEFVFPKCGIVVIGSEELGVSPESLHQASYGRVTIPMKGIKASLNVGVAFGILMQSWVSALC